MGFDAHSVAAIALCQKMGWTYDDKHEWGHTHLIGGALKNNYVFVFGRRCENRLDLYRLPEAN